MEENKQLRKKLLVGGIAYAALIVGILLVANVQRINGWIIDALMLFRPVINGLVIAYFCNPFFRFFERKLLCRLNPPKLRRALALILAFAALFAIVSLLLWLLLPQLVESAVDLATNYDSYVTSAIHQVNKSIAWLNDSLEYFTKDPTFIPSIDGDNWRETVSDFFGSQGTNLMDYLKNINVNGIISTMSEFVGVVTDLIFGLFVAIYLLASKEKRVAQIAKLRRAILNDDANERLGKAVEIANRSFGGFIRGKLLDSSIVALLMFVITFSAGIPYSVLLSVTIGIFNCIPIIGPLIGAIPTTFILILAAPGKVIPFLLILLGVILLDNNVIAPKILGNNTGVSSLCVVIAITTMGSLWGLAGMLLGVPLFATILELVDITVIERLQKKGLPSGLANYYAPDTVVDPLEDIRDYEAKLRRRFERAILRILKKKEQPKADCNLWERFLYRCYLTMKKLRLASEFATETVVQFETEELLKDADAQSEKAFADMIARERENADAVAPDKAQ